MGDTGVSSLLPQQTKKTRQALTYRVSHKQMVRRQGFEPWTLGLRVPCSGQLS